MPLTRPALLVQFQPITPWRCGAGHPAEPASLVPSDSLFGAICHAFGLLGWRQEWLETGAARTRFTSLLPFQHDIFHAPIPEPLRRQPALRRLLLEAVRFAPLAAVGDLAANRFDESRWVLDLGSGCLLAADRAGSGGPFKPLNRQRAAVDRLTGESILTASTSGLEFASAAGLWTVFVFGSEADAAIWTPRMKAACRLLADEGIGGWRQAGWGRSRRPRFREGTLERVTQFLGWQQPAPDAPTAWWTLGLFIPSPDDSIAWNAGAYRTLLRQGWTPGSGQKPAQRFVREGAILSSAAEPLGHLLAAEMDGAGFPVTRYGAGLALPWKLEP